MSSKKLQELSKTSNNNSLNQYLKKRNKNQDQKSSVCVLENTSLYQVSSPSLQASQSITSAISQIHSLNVKLTIQFNNKKTIII